MAAGEPLSRAGFAAALRGLSARYWDSHYQRTLSQKNAAIIANCPLPEVRRRWIERIDFQDTGGLDDWLALGDAVGLSRPEILDAIDYAAAR